MTEPTSDEVKEAMVKAGVPDDKAEWLLDMERMKNEELIPELQSYVEESPTWGKSLKHPMAYRQKRKALDEAIDQEDWATVIWIHERAYRCDALLDYVVGRDEFDEVVSLTVCTDEAKALAADVWVDSENIHQHIEDWTRMFSGWNPGDPMLFNDDPEGWAKLPKKLTVYRAGIDDGGWSWTLDPKVAEFFANRFGERHVMSYGYVQKEHCFGYLTRRSEAEVLLLDGAVFGVRPFAGVEK
jgi:hypothetical protein